MQYCKTVTLRSRARRNGTLSLFLDFYPGFRDVTTMKLIRRQALGIYIYAKPINERQRKYNAEMLEKAEAIRCRVFGEVIDERYDFFNKNRLRSDFLAWYKKLLPQKNKKWEFVFKHFERFVDGKCSFEEINVDLCNKFKEYLLTAKSLRNDEQIARNSVAGYWSTFRAMLNIAYRERLIKDNVNDFLDRIKYTPTVKESLTMEELRKLNNTPCEIDILKRASIFSCLTGIRRSDLINMTWNNIRHYSDGHGMYVEFISQKTKTDNIIPIGDEAIQLLPEKTSIKVFPGLTREMTNAPLKKWLKDAGINKHITFHCFRHTFASLQVELGTDIYTVQDLLAHKNVSTTQIYARHNDPKKREASQKIKLSVV